ncbi:FAD/NAD(P)-binding domain-containing protein [Trametes coccinea BRFM310]|uniref:FAD/NAD(P)-binding domain-containing protein n=1 Tax=Trametes coccinea (strain BRFM310) TaxID=1353009 RepID=A0A1Y2IL34_TRAC3|nr:FAD/NAD(P)-binding domain-containing protein [Trametes coccinea BRFM310]
MPDGSTSAKPRFRLAIVGGGIAGLTLAVTLGRYAEKDSAPIEVHMYESGPEITTVGAGISVWPRTWDVMRHLELFEQLAEQSVQPPGRQNGEPKPAFIFRKSDWNHEGYEFGRVMVPQGCTTMHRADMVAVLVKNLPGSCSIHTSKRLTHYTETTKTEGERAGSTVYTLHFADGTTSETDVLIGADGIKSKTRSSMYDIVHSRECRNDVVKDECERCKRATPKWTGTVGYRYLIPSERMREVNPEHNALKIKAPLSYSGKGKHIITYPISHGKYLNWIGFVTIPGGEGTTYPRKWVVDATQQEVAAHFTGWEPEVDEMLQLVEKPTVWAIHVVQNLPLSVYGAVALMGDAVHAMQTHFGAGGGQAIEDAYILGCLLADSRTTLARVPDVFRIYQDVRLPFAQRVVNEASKAGLMYEFNCPGLYDGSTPHTSSEEDAFTVEKRQLDELGKAIQEIWQWQWKERVEEQWEDAQRKYQEVVGVRGRKWMAGCVTM